MNNQSNLKRRLTQTLTYLYGLVFQSWLFIHFLITIMSAFKTGNVVLLN